MNMHKMALAEVQFTLLILQVTLSEVQFMYSHFQITDQNYILSFLF